MKKIMRLMLVPMLMILAAPAYSAPVSMFMQCELEDEATNKDVNAVAAKWLKAAKGVKGGENLEVNIHYPVVAHLPNTDFVAVLRFPSTSEFGIFFDGYQGSAAHKLDKEWDQVAACPNSALWRSVKVE